MVKKRFNPYEELLYAALSLVYVWAAGNLDDDTISRAHIRLYQAAEACDEEKYRQAFHEGTLRGRMLREESAPKRNL